MYLCYGPGKVQRTISDREGELYKVLESSRNTQEKAIIKKVPISQPELALNHKDLGINKLPKGKGLDCLLTAVPPMPEDAQCAVSVRLYYPSSEDMNACLPKG